MIIHNETRPLAALAVFILVCMVLLGLLLAGTELLNPKSIGLEADGKATQKAQDNQATQVGYDQDKAEQEENRRQRMTATARPIQATQTAQAIEIEQTAIPQQRTASALAVQVSLDDSSANATQIALEVRIQGERTSLNATATALARNQERERQHDDTDRISGILGLAGSGGLLAALSTLALSLAKWLRSRARINEKEALARLQAERRRTIALEAAVRQAPRPSQSTLALKPGSDENPKKN
jgi:hypothetical protein